VKIVTVDSFEFDNPSTEEFVEIAVAKKSKFPFPAVEQFVAVRIGVTQAATLPTADKFDQCPGSLEAREHLLKFAGIPLPEACAWETYRFSSGPDDWSFVICTPTQFIHYSWGSSA